jgi:hypothetical protein
MRSGGLQLVGRDGVYQEYNMGIMLCISTLKSDELVPGFTTNLLVLQSMNAMMEKIFYLALLNLPLSFLLFFQNLLSTSLSHTITFFLP